MHIYMTDKSPSEHCKSQQVLQIQEISGGQPARMPSGDVIPAVTGVKALVDAGLDKVPSKYIRPLKERANANVVAGLGEKLRLPVIDLSKLDGPDRAATLEAIHQACKEWGFFQVVNHGVPSAWTNGVRNLAEDFFELPVEEKLKFKQPQPGVLHPCVGDYSTSLTQFCEQEVTHDWRDVLTHYFLPGSREDATGAWPDKPSSLYKETVLGYHGRVQALAYKLLTLFAENLGLAPDYFQQNTVVDNILAFSYYPRCPEPDLALGVKSHADFGLVTVLLPHQVAGLQVKKDDQWIPVEPNLDAFVVNIGDSMQAISNDVYRSADHRATLNYEKHRVSVTLFVQPEKKQLLSVAPQLVSPQHPAVYRPYTFQEFLQVVYKAPELPDANAVLRTFRLPGL